MSENKRFRKWKFPKFDEKGMNKWNWMDRYHKNLKIGKYSDIDIPVEFVRKPTEKEIQQISEEIE